MIMRAFLVRPLPSFNASSLHFPACRFFLSSASGKPRRRPEVDQESAVCLGDTVSIQFRVRDSELSLVPFSSPGGRSVVRFKVGAEGYDARLSAELEGMRVGERKRIRIDPGDKGLISNPEYNPNAVFKVSKDLFGEDRNSIRVGDLVELCSNEEQIFGQNIDDLFGQGGTLEQSGLSREQFEAARKKLRDKYSGDEMTLTKAYVKEVGKKFLVLDLNNPLTGKTLFIDLRIRRILERGGDYVKDPEGPSDEELEEDEP